MYNKETDHLIWSNENLNIVDWYDDLHDEHPDMNETELIEEMYRVNDEYFNDEKANLDIVLNQPILVFADIGKWYGRYQGYGLVRSKNIKDCLYSGCDYATWYVNKDGDLRCDAVHHDGHNFYLYRVLKENITEDDIEAFSKKIYSNSATKEDIEQITDKLGDVISKVYGWVFKDEDNTKLNVENANSKLREQFGEEITLKIESYIEDDGSAWYKYCGATTDGEGFNNIEDCLDAACIYMNSNF